MLLLRFSRTHILRPKGGRALAQHRPVETRRAGLIGAATVFERKGYSATTINDIVQEAGITKGALYFHWPSKRDIARAILAEEPAWMATIQLDPENPLQTAVDATYGFIQALEDDVVLRASVRLTVEYTTFSEEPGSYGDWSEVAESVFDAACQAGQILPGFTSRDLGRTVTSMVLGIQMSSTALGTRSKMKQYVHTFWRAFLPGIANPGVAQSVKITPPRAKRTSRTR